MWATQECRNGFQNIENWVRLCVYPEKEKQTWERRWVGDVVRTMLFGRRNKDDIVSTTLWMKLKIIQIERYSWLIIYIAYASGYASQMPLFLIVWLLYRLYKTVTLSDQLLKLCSVLNAMCSVCLSVWNNFTDPTFNLSEWTIFNTGMKQDCDFWALTKLKVYSMLRTIKFETLTNNWVV